MYQFTSPFNIEWKMVNKLREKFKEKIKTKKTDLKLGEIETEINLETLHIPDETYTEYGVEIKENKLEERIIITISDIFRKEKQMLIKIESEIKDSEKVISEILSYYGIISYDFLPGNYQSREKTEEVVRNIIFQHEEKYRWYDGLITPKTDHRESIYFVGKDYGFYYFLSNWGLNRKENELMDIQEKAREYKSLVDEIQELIKENNIRIVVGYEEHRII